MATYSAGSAAITITPRMDRFADELRSRLRNVDASFAVDVEADLTRLRQQMAQLQSEDFRVNVNADLDDALARTRLDELTRDRTVNVRVDVDRGGLDSLGGAAGGIGNSANETARLGGSLAGIAGAGASVAGIGSAVAGIGGAAGLAGGAVGGLALGFIGLAGAAVPALATIALGFDGIKEAAQTITPQFDALKSAISGTFATELAPTFAAIGNAMTALTPGMEGIARSMSGVFDAFSYVFTSPEGIETLQGLLGGVSEMFDSMGLGVTLFGESLRTMLGNVTPALSSIGEGLGVFMAQIGLALSQIDPSFFVSFGEMLKPIGALLGDVVRTLTTLGSAVMPALGPLFLALGDALTTMAGPLGEMGAVFAQALTPVLPILADLIGMVASGLTPILPVLSEALQTVGSTIMAALPTAIPVFQSLIGVVGQLLAAVAPLLPPLIQLASAILTPLIGIVSQLVTAMAPFITQLISQLSPVITSLTPMLAQVGQMLGGAMVQALQSLMPIIQPFVQALVNMLQAVLPMLPAWANLATQLMPIFLVGIQTLLPVLTVLIQAFTEWAQLVMPLVTGGLNAVAAVIGTVGGVVNGFLEIWTTVMNGIKEAVTGAKDWVVGRFDDLVNMITGLPARITTAASNMFGGVQDAFRGALNWIVKAWNDFKIEMRVPDDIPIIGGKGFTIDTPDLGYLATGGPVTGPGGPRDDQVLIAASNGEYVINAASTAAYRPLIEAINSGSLPKFADGGEVGAMNYARSMDGTPYQMAGFGPGGIDCSAFVSAIVNVFRGLDPYDSRMSTVTEGEWLTAKGFTLGTGGPGDLRVGWWDEGGGYNGHTAGTFSDGTNFESGGNSGGAKVGGTTGYDDPQFTNHAFAKVTPAVPPPVDGNPYVPTPGTDPGPAGWGGTGSAPSGSPSTSYSSSSMPTTWSGFAGDFAQKAGTILAKGALSFFGIADEIPPIVKGIQEYDQFQGQNQQAPDYTSTAGVDNTGNTGLMPPSAAPAPAVVAPTDNTPQGAVKRAFQPLGWDTGANWDAADWIIGKESSWDPLAENPSSGAFGLFQFNPSSGTLQEYLPDRNPDPFIQGQAGGNYISDRYGTPVEARTVWEAQGWYANGGYVSGPGGPRDDAVPLFLSNGEYVVNAASTAANLPILEAINSGQPVAAGVDRSVHFHGGIQALDAHAAMREADRRMSLATVGTMGALPG